ncbi:MAG: hypothetical protein K8W52_09730 [Deltaproteobacteria bacterium]|nr:hypothetical protein [Deltaproteobacteria bacterium]
MAFRRVRVLVIALCGFSVVITLALWLVSRRVSDSAALATMARLIGGEVDHGAARATGQLAGRRVTIENLTNETTHWTEVTVEVGGALDLEVRTRSDRAPTSDAEIDLGDPAFRDRYIVEGAPSAQVRAVLTADARARLLAIAPIHVRLRGGELHLISPRLVRDDDDATALVGLTAALLAGVGTAGDVDPVRADAERARLSEVRSARDGRTKVAALIVLGTIAAIAVAIIVALLRRHGPPPP